MVSASQFHKLCLTNIHLGDTQSLLSRTDPKQVDDLQGKVCVHQAT